MISQIYTTAAVTGNGRLYALKKTVDLGTDCSALIDFQKTVEGVAGVETPASLRLKGAVTESPPSPFKTSIESEVP